MVFPFMICLAYSGILIGDRSPKPIAFFFLTDLSFSTPLALIPFALTIGTSFGRITSLKSVLFYLGLFILSTMTFLFISVTGNGITHLSSVPFWISSLVTVTVRQLENPES